jgi:hypothetical protein
MVALISCAIRKNVIEAHSFAGQTNQRGFAKVFTWAYFVESQY